HLNGTGLRGGERIQGVEHVVQETVSQGDVRMLVCWAYERHVEVRALLVLGVCRRVAFTWVAVKAENLLFVVSHKAEEVEVRLEEVGLRFGGPGPALEVLTSNTVNVGLETPLAIVRVRRARTVEGREHELADACNWIPNARAGGHARDRTEQPLDR